MTTKFYQINGVWNTYQYWHDNYGYTTEPTQSMNFKSSASGTWGTNVNPGYFTSPGGYTIDNWSFWSDGIVGWKDLDQLALAGAYPATAIDILLERNGSIANAVYVDDSDELYYLIDGYLSDGWRPWDEVEADGWQVYEGAPPYYMVVNETTGEIVYSISETEENPSMVFSQVGHIEMPDSEMITVYETGVPVQSFYFTTNGRNETQNTNISWSDIPVYNEDGTAPSADTPYADSSVLAFMDVDGNTKQAQGEGLYVNDGILRLDAPDTDEGEQWAALVEKVFPDILTLWAKITDNSEKMYLQTRVINTSTPNSTYLYALYTDEALTQRFVIDSNKTYELGVFKGQNFAPYDIQDVSQMPSTTVSGSGAVSGFLLVDQSGAYLWAATNNTYSTYVNASGNKLSFKCRVSEPPAPSLPTVEKTYGWATTGSSAEYCYNRRSVTLYDNNRNSIQYDSTKSYVVQIGNGSGSVWNIEFFCASDSSGFLVAWNRTNVTLMVLGVSLYSCSSNSAYRVIVSDSSNVKYPAFAYDLDGTTYYYVLDDTQTDWTIDLSSIGYSLVIGSEAYLTSLGSSETTNTLIGNSSFYLYSSSGTYLYGDQSKKYVLIGQFLENGTNVTNDGMDSRLTDGMTCSGMAISTSVSSYNRLMLSGSLYGYEVFKITYLEV